MSAPPVRPSPARAGCDLRPVRTAFQGLCVCGVISQWRKQTDLPVVVCGRVVALWCPARAACSR